jgi:hypothetical protein
MPGVQGLATGVRCSGKCMITQQETSHGGDKVVQMYDNQCYYISAITEYIKKLIQKGFTLGHPQFLLPTKKPITSNDLKMLYLNPKDFARIEREWKSSPEYTEERARMEHDALTAARAAAASDNVHVPLIGDSEGKHTVNTVTRWGIFLDQDEEQDLPIPTINKIDNYVLRGITYDCDYNDDENIKTRRRRNLGLHEFERVFSDAPIEPGFKYGIMFEGGVYNTLEELAVAMAKPVGDLQMGPPRGGKKTKKTQRKTQIKRKRKRKRQTQKRQRK